VPGDKVELKDQEKKLAQQLIESLAAPFDPQKYRDEYMENVKGMIDAKLKGQEVTQAAQPHMAPVIDLMEALKKSLAEKQAPAVAASSSAAPVGKKPPTRALQPVAVVQKKVGKKAAG
jgi:DNA end-binding protein Ku